MSTWNLKRSFGKELEEVVKEAKRNREWRHEYMTLLMRDQENREIGRAEGIVEGIQALISTLRELDTSDMVILQKLMEKFNLTEKEARNYLA